MRRYRHVTLGVGALAIACAMPSPAADTWQTSGRAAVERARALPRHTGPAKNVLIFVGDGMGVSTVTAARILEGQRRGENGEEGLLAFEHLPYVALIKTYNTNQQVPDSAGTMTAIVSGSKTRAGVIAVDSSTTRGDHSGVEGHRLPTLFDYAEKRGLATGVVTTARLTHATPAAFYAHSPERGWESDADLSKAARAAGFPDIALQLVDSPHGNGLDVAMGGGRRAFLPQEAVDPEEPEVRGARLDGRDLTAEWAARKGSSWVWNRDQLMALDMSTTDRILGLFESSHMEFEAQRADDRGGEPSLAEMTTRALDRLERNEKGWLLIVEGGRIDHGHHASSAYLALHDAIAFSEAVAAALVRIDLSETLVVVTADHGHVFHIAGYPTRGNPILGKVRDNDARGEPKTGFARDAGGRPYTTLGYGNGPGHVAASDKQPAGPKRYPHFPTSVGAAGARPDLADVDTASPSYLQESAVPMTSETHSGEDVPLYAGGAGAHLFHGVQEQSFVYHAIVAALGWE